MPFIPDKPSGFVPDQQPQNDPVGYLSRLAEYVKNPEGPIEPVLSATRDVYNAVATPIEALGNMANQGNQMLSQAMQSRSMPLPVQIAGGVYSKVSPYLNPIPTNAIGMAALPLMAGEAAGIFSGGQKTIPVGSQLLNEPGRVQETIAHALSAVNRVKPNQVAAVIANPEILSDTTPSLSEVSNMYKSAFEQAGMKIDDVRYKFLTGLTRPLREQQIGRAEHIVDMALDPRNPSKLREGLTDTEAFIARTAASKLAQSTTAASNPAYKAAVIAQQDMFDDFLENSSLPQIRQLNRLWFMAKTKAAMLEPLPLNKQGSPNALSNLLMMMQLKKSAENFGEGAMMRGTANFGTGILMSPAIGGTVIKGVNAGLKNPGVSTQILSNALGGQSQQ